MNRREYSMLVGGAAAKWAQRVSAQQQTAAPGNPAPRLDWLGEVLVVESALTPLAVEGISFTVEGPATYAEAIPAFRTPPTHQIQ